MPPKGKSFLNLDCFSKLKNYEKIEKLYCAYPRTVVPKILCRMLPALYVFIKLYFF